MNFMESSANFPPRPITNEAELIATQNRINSILDRGKLTQGDRDYLKVLGILVYDYEQQNEPMPSLKGGELLKALLEESNFHPKDLVPICESELTVLEVMNGNRKLTAEEIEKIATFFHISPTAF